MPPRLPLVAVLLGVGGLVPFAGCAFLALSLPPDEAAVWLQALLGYGAVILSFVGAVHWGIVLTEPTPIRQGWRLVFGVGPSLIGWGALLIAPLGQPAWAVALLIAGMVFTVIVEARLRRRGLMPRGYMWLRWGLSLAVVLILAGTLAALLTGARILL